MLSSITRNVRFIMVSKREIISSNPRYYDLTIYVESQVLGERSPHAKEHVRIYKQQLVCILVVQSFGNNGNQKFIMNIQKVNRGDKSEKTVNKL